MGAEAFVDERLCCGLFRLQLEYKLDGHKKKGAETHAYCTQDNRW